MPDKITKKEYAEAIRKFRACKPGEGLKKGYVKTIAQYEREHGIIEGYFDSTLTTEQYLEKLLSVPRIDLEKHRLLLISRVRNEPLYYLIAQDRETGALIALFRCRDGDQRRIGTDEKLQYLQDTLDEGLKVYCGAENIPIAGIDHIYPPDGSGQEQVDWLVTSRIMEPSDGQAGGEIFRLKGVRFFGEDRPREN
ncbi:MAG: hypothetical protein ABSA57_20790 [Candidatus Acidiferrales bacterium]|jgi:hypothetical protein